MGTLRSINARRCSIGERETALMATVSSLSVVPGSLIRIAVITCQSNSDVLFSASVHNQHDRLSRSAAENICFNFVFK
jgi:hypothetical protein